MDEKNPQVRAACYCRISSDPDDRREGVERQREDTTALCEVKGWTPAGYYVDNDRSASNGKERPEWERLLADVKSGEVDAIAAWDQDRGWRMMHELEALRKFFTSLGRQVPLATTGQGDIDLYSPTGVMMAQIKTAVSEHEIAMMKVRMRRAARQRAELGVPKWKRAFGYLGDTHQPDPVTAPLVEKAYATVLAGGSISDIARGWNEAGHYGLNGKPWSPSTVSLFLRKPRNAGLRDHHGEIVCKATWPALVDESTWRAAQSVLNAPGRARRKTIRRHLLTGMLRCGCDGCDAHLAGQWVMSQGTGRKPGRPKAGEPLGPKAQKVPHRIVYACKVCHGCSVRAELVEPMIFGMVAERLAQPDAVDLLKSASLDEAEAQTLRTERMALLTRLDEIADAVADGDLTPKQARRATERVTEKLTVIDSRERDAEKLRVFADLPLGTEEVADKLVGLSADRFRAVLDALAEVTVKPVGKGWRPPNGERFDPDRVVFDWR
ncbi:recombinase family protein [Mycolicibacterium septicum]|uniref:recombinase family protein n=1 Tax=Mycolicibacterium septicum TaxID=98668 RepID=UPI001F3BC9FA|nr:recombinase family protein [Mycolicibacterium septicum]